MSTPAPATRPTATQTTPAAPRTDGNGGNLALQGGPGSSTINAGVVLRYLESSPILVRGPVSGLHYEFSGKHPEQAVDARDVESLLQTRFFRRRWRY